MRNFANRPLKLEITQDILNISHVVPHNAYMRNKLICVAKINCADIELLNRNSWGFVQQRAFPASFNPSGES